MSEIKIHGIYKHYKGDFYIVEDVATHTETGEQMVIYRGLYESAPLWVRPLDLFLSKVEGKPQKHRFELQDIKSVAEH